MDQPAALSDRLRTALKAVNLSPAALGAAVGVDKSVVSRWLAGRVVPNGHNLARVAAEIARHRPGFSVLSFEAPEAEFRSALGLGGHQGAEAVAPPPPDGADPRQSLAIPFRLLDSARNETARRGIEYFGHYAMHYMSFGTPGKVARMTLMLRPRDGLIEARYGAREFEFRGWALLLLNRLYIMFAEERFEAMAYIVTNAGQQPRARTISGILMGPSEGMLTPTAAPVVLTREADVTGDVAADDDAYLARKDFDPICADDAVPAALRRALSRDCGPRAFAEGGDLLLRMPFGAGAE